MRTITMLLATSITLAAPLAARAADPCGELLLSTADDELASWLQLDDAQLGALQAIRQDADAAVQSWQSAAASAVAVLSAGQRGLCMSAIDYGPASPATVVVQHSPTYVPPPWHLRRGAVVVNRRPIALRRGYARSHSPVRRVTVRRTPYTRTVYRPARTHRPAPTVYRPARTHSPTPKVYRPARTHRPAPTVHRPAQRASTRSTPAGSTRAQSRGRRGHR